MAESDRTTLTFRQAEGSDPLPTQLNLRDISDEARALLWHTCCISLRRSAVRDESTNWQVMVGSNWIQVLLDWHVRIEFQPVDEFIARMDLREPLLKTSFMYWDYDRLFDFITFVIRHNSGPNITAQWTTDFSDARMAYYISENTIFPQCSELEADTFRAALADTAKKKYNGAQSHLIDAGDLASRGDWAGSVRESIHAVESVAKVIEPSASTLSDALKKLAASGSMNPNLKRGLEALYNYSSDEAGIRHAKVFEAEANVDEADALYMLGACASFVSLLIARARSLC